MLKKPLILLSLALLLFSCKGRQPAQNARTSRPFPTVEVPGMISENSERAEWLSLHLWDRFMDSTTFHGSDSLKLNGVLREDVEKQIGTYVTLLQMIPPKAASGAVKRAFSLSEGFSVRYPESGMLEDFAELFRKYVYDPASPVRDEELWLHFLESLLSSDVADANLKTSREWEMKVCSMNRPGTAAADFAFTDLAGRKRSLYGIKAQYTVLIFGNPDCHACKELTVAFRENPEIEALIRSGKVKVVDIYIDEDIEAWKAAGDSYPSEWINGYDHLGRIRADRIYAVRAIPSIYLLDSSKTILLKDTPENRLLSALAGL